MCVYMYELFGDPREEKEEEKWKSCVSGNVCIYIYQSIYVLERSELQSWEEKSRQDLDHSWPFQMR